MGLKFLSIIIEASTYKLKLILVGISTKDERLSYFLFCGYSDKNMAFIFDSKLAEWGIPALGIIFEPILITCLRILINNQFIKNSMDLPIHNSKRTIILYTFYYFVTIYLINFFPSRVCQSETSIPGGHFILW